MIHAGANVNWVLISEHGWGGGAFTYDTTPVERFGHVLFPAYNSGTLAKVKHTTNVCLFRIVCLLTHLRPNLSGWVA